MRSDGGTFYQLTHSPYLFLGYTHETLKKTRSILVQRFQIESQTCLRSFEGPKLIGVLPGGLPRMKAVLIVAPPFLAYVEHGDDAAGLTQSLEAAPWVQIPSNVTLIGARGALLESTTERAVTRRLTRDSLIQKKNRTAGMSGGFKLGIDTERSWLSWRTSRETLTPSALFAVGWLPSVVMLCGIFLNPFNGPSKNSEQVDSKE